MNTSEYCFVTKLSPDEIKNIVSKQKSSLFSSDIVAGKAYGNKIEISYCSYFSNSWKPVFYGIVSKCDDEVTITGNFKIDESAKFFMKILRSFMIFMGVIILLGVIVNSEVRLLFLLIIPLFMYIIFHVMEGIGINAGERDREDILRSIKESLLASPSTSST